MNRRAFALALAAFVVLSAATVAQWRSVCGDPENRATIMNAHTGESRTNCATGLAPPLAQALLYGLPAFAVMAARRVVQAGLARPPGLRPVSPSQA